MAQGYRQELKLLNEMGTWELVEKLLDAIAIPNKWAFVKKRDKGNQVTCHKVRLVVKGCAQHPGHEFTEMYSLVVRVETLRACLALVPVKGLRSSRWTLKEHT